MNKFDKKYYIAISVLLFLIFLKSNSNELSFKIKEGFANNNDNNNNKKKKYNNTLKNYINYQKNKSPSINLPNLVKGIENTISLIKDNKKPSTKDKFKNTKKPSTKTLLKEKFIEGEEVIEEEDQNEELKQQLKNELEEEIQDEEDELDDNIIGYFNYIFKTLFEKGKSLFDNNFNNILSNKKQELFKNSDNMIGGGILFVIVSLGLYFIDITI